MNEIESSLGIANKNWLMSTREKLALIGLLQCMNPKNVIEFGYHRGGATKWLTKFAQKVITVDVNEFVGEASAQYANLEAWNCTTIEAIKKIKQADLSFDLAIIDADHSKLAVANDVKGILPHAEVILMHDSFNPGCRKGMLSALKSQNTHAYFLDFIPSVLKHDGLWGGLAIAWRSEYPGPTNEYLGERSSYKWLKFQSLFYINSKMKTLRILLLKNIDSFICFLRILGGKLRK